jgi:glucan-binding YG repeat protein
MKKDEKNKFTPDLTVTREELAVILTAYAKATGYSLVAVRNEINFADLSEISNTAQASVKAVLQAGIMEGKEKNKFYPKANVTRAEVAVILQRYIGVTINTDTEFGWSRNDAGQISYYKDGKRITGWQILDGKKYFFYNTGILYTGWKQQGVSKYYLTADGPTVGWLVIKNKRYYFVISGVMVSGKWLKINQTWYYFNQDGSLAVNTTIDGYKVDGKGVRINQ